MYTVHVLYLTVCKLVITQSIANGVVGFDEPLLKIQNSNETLKDNTLTQTDMKKITQTALSLIIALILCPGLSADVTAQSWEKESINIFFGLGAPNIARSYVKGLSKSASVQTAASGLGPLTFTCQYGASRKFAIGIQAGYQSGASAPLSWEQPNDLGGTTTRNYTMNMRLYTFLAKADFHYTKGRALDLYSGFSVGYGIAHVIYTGIEDPEAIKDFGSLKGFAYSVNAIGCRLMLPRHFGAFAELGYGIHGIATVGVTMSTGGKYGG
jgi:hypothetical protein